MTAWKRTWCRFLLVLTLAMGLALPAAADVGPKPSVEVVLQGLEGQRCYVTLLADRKGSGPWSAEHDYSDWMGDRAAWEAFAGYDIPEGWYFWGEYADCTETGRFVWSYYPPARFYILAWLPDSGRFVRSETPVERYAFDSRFTATVSGETFTVARSYDYAGAAAGLLGRAALTVAIETAAGWLLFGLRRRDQMTLILKVNLATQLALNLLLGLAAYGSGPMLAALVYIPLEAAVFGAEGAVYARRMPWPEGSRPHPWLYSLGANAISFAAGWGLAGYGLPGL